MTDLAEGRAMTDTEGLMWRLEQDPFLSSNIALVAILDRRPDLDVVRARIERATYLIPRLRHRVRAGNLGPPTFELDPYFDLDAHIRHVALPAPGRRRQLYDLAALLAMDPFDVNRPLWQIIIVDGLKKGRSAVIIKAHHTITDGEGGIELALHLVDFERHAVPPPMPDPDTIAEAEERATASSPDALQELIANTMRIPLGITQQVRDLLADPSRIPDARNAASDSLRGLIGELTDTEPARSPLWTERGLGRRLVVGRAPLDTTREVSKLLGGTLNTAFVTIAAEAASRYHVAMGAPTDSLRASMAVSTRTADSGANAFSLVRMVAPTAEMPITDRFHEVQRSIEAAMDQAEGGAMEAVAGLSALLPTSVISRLARQQTQTVDFGTSNVRGAPVPIYVGGAKLRENYPIGPTIGTAFNLTLLSYCNRLDMGLNVDRTAVEDPDLLARSLRDAVDEFVAVST